MRLFPSLKTSLSAAGFVALVGGTYFGISSFSGVSYEQNEGAASSTPVAAADMPKSFVATHVASPEPMKALYMTACVAGVPSWRTQLMKLVDETELNAIIIDIKDYSGTISFDTTRPEFKDHAGTGCRVKDMREFIQTLHEHDIYVIGRITVFQDPLYTKLHPELAVQSISTGGPWKDYKGLSFVDVSAKPYWDYVVALAKDSYEAGFDELNFDYVRFPSDGNMKDTKYVWSGTTPKALALRAFFEYLHGALKDTGAVLSADLFGMTTTNTDDLNIGQVLEHALPYFDYIYPMVYPSHYPKGFNGWSNPNQHVYEIIKFSMDRAVARALSTTTVIANLPESEPIASTTPQRYTKPVYDKLKLRPWIQDFDYGGTYGEVEVRAQIQATYDAGLTSWLLWDPANKYTPSALKRE